MAGRHLYRKAAIRHHFAQGDVDEALRVSRPSDWIVIGAVTVLAALVLTWAFVGSLPVMVQGKGLILPAGGIAQVKTEDGGVVLTPPPANGRRVKNGDLLVRIIPETNRQSLKNSIKKENDAEHFYRAQKSAYAAVKKASEEAQNTYIKLMTDNLKKLKEIVSDQERQYANLKELYGKQMTTISELLAAEEAAAGAYRSYNQARIQLAQQKVSVREDLLRQELSLRSAQSSYLSAREDRKYQEALVKSGEIRAPMDGVVRQCVLQAGDSAAAGTPVCLLEGEGEPDLVYLFFKTDDAERLKVGGPARVEVLSYPADRYGKLIGRVTAIAPLPATRELIEESAGYSGILARELESGAPVSRVTVRLETVRRNGKTVFRKTGAGAPFPVVSGMVCRGEAVVERQVPITLVIPALKKWFGVTEI